MGADWKEQVGRGEEEKWKTFVSTHISCEKVHKVSLYSSVSNIMRNSGVVAHRYNILVTGYMFSFDAHI